MKKNKEMYRNIVLLIFGFYCFICMILAPVGNLLIQKANGTWGDIFSLGQFLADLCLIPFAIVAFYLTLHELQKSQERADLYITWEETDKTEYSSSIKRNQLVTYQSKKVSLKNKGTTPSTLYQITLDISIDYGRVLMINSPHWTGSIQGDYHKFTFTGAPHLTLFPNSPQIDLGNISFSNPEKLPNKITINYYMASEKSEYKSGSLKIHLNEIESKEEQ